jgi:hypothetical protein
VELKEVGGSEVAKKERVIVFMLLVGDTKHKTTDNSASM